ncbi:helicase-related protein [Tepidiforma sp.]|uniref:helicase-related protein n=1 Tax=Tepidiforma sp. TaxID=2682230 RepID=UPI002ADDD3C7|nr:helicase-related protein [Tepidiforma sp.]
MERLADLVPGARVEGLVPGETVVIVSVKHHGGTIATVVYRVERSGKVGDQIVYQHQLPTLQLVEAPTAWAFDSNGDLFRLASEARRIQLAWMFDPMLGLHTSNVEPLPHQIAAVYQAMLPRQPLRFLLADDPGAGKTIMAGLLIRELMLRGDIERCLIVCPANLGEQWQDELSSKFDLRFDLVGRAEIESSVSNNPFSERNLVISRIDLLKQDDNMARLNAADDWDLVIVDEAHKMSAQYYQDEIKRTARYRLGELLSRKARHFLLMTATPHRGRDEDFQLFMALLDGDRFESQLQLGPRQADVSDMMRRMLKEELVDFDGHPLFPERRAYTVNYELSDQEALLYEQVTHYVAEEMNRADRLLSEGNGRGRVVGFALTLLQRRMASSPAAIHESLKRRLRRLEHELEEARQTRRVAEAERSEAIERLLRAADPEDLEADLEEEPESETQEIVDQATAARTVEELEAEVKSLRRLATLAKAVRESKVDRKWDKLREVLEFPEMFETGGGRRKLVIFTEHRDTLDYLVQRIRDFLGRSEAVVAIHGGLLREERQKAQERFVNDPDAIVLVATDAAGEGINLQRAHLMVNYDLPWNPNRLEQRFGRIHRFGQREVCHLWNLVAYQTREGAVYQRLFEKLEEERDALGGKVFDVLGRVFTEVSLKNLMLEAIRYNSTEEARQYLEKKIESQWDPALLRRLLEERSLDATTLAASRLRELRDEMDRAEARRLVPHFVESFFVEAFRRLGGSINPREPGRYQVTHVPAELRRRDRIIGRGAPVMERYERICFDRANIHLDGKPQATFIAPGHPLLRAVIDLILERHRDALARGTILVDPAAERDRPRVMFAVESTLVDGVTNADGSPRVISRRMDYIEVDDSGNATSAGAAPYLDYRPLAEGEEAAARALLATVWTADNLEELATDFALRTVVDHNFKEVAGQRQRQVDRTMAAVKQRLTAAIQYWDHRAIELREMEEVGKKTRLSSQNAAQRRDDLERRLGERLERLKLEREVRPRPPLVQGAAFVIPESALRPASPGDPLAPPRETGRVEAVAMACVMEHERAAGREPIDVSAHNRGWDIESREPDGRLRFIEVKGRRPGASTVCITRNELLTCLNMRDQFWLAVVTVDGDRAVDVEMYQDPLAGDWSFAMASQNLNLHELRKNAAEAPA